MSICLWTHEDTMPQHPLQPRRHVHLSMDTWGHDAAAPSQPKSHVYLSMETWGHDASAPSAAQTPCPFVYRHMRTRCLSTLCGLEAISICIWTHEYTMPQHPLQPRSHVYLCMDTWGHHASAPSAAQKLYLFGLEAMSICVLTREDTVLIIDILCSPERRSIHSSVTRRRSASHIVALRNNVK